MNKLVRNIRIKKCIFSVIIIILFSVNALAGCDQVWNKAIEKPDDSIRIIYNVYAETFMDDTGSPVLEAKIVYPQIFNADSKNEIDIINQYLYEQMKAYRDIIATEGVYYAREDKDASVAGEYEFMIHTYTQTPKITYNGNGYLSIVYFRMEVTGGARPNIYLKAESFKVTTGERLSLEDFLGYRAESTVANVAAREIRLARQKGDTSYYDTYSRDVKRWYDPEDFYLSGKALTAFYQTDTIAPYTSGIPSFNISYNDFRMRKRVPAIPETDEQAELYIVAEELLERNHFVFSEVYGLSMLEMDMTKGNTIDKETYYPVIDPGFAEHEDLFTYLGKTYTTETVEKLLGNGMYKDVSGRLYGNPRVMDRSRYQYTIDWSNYGFEVVLESDIRAKLIIYNNEDDPARPKHINTSTELVKENGKWVLSGMIY